MLVRLIGVSAIALMLTAPSWALGPSIGKSEGQPRMQLAAAARCLGSKEISAGVNAGQSWHGKKCDSKNGCACQAVECTQKGKVTFQNVVCSPVPG